MGKSSNSSSSPRARCFCSGFCCSFEVDCSGSATLGSVVVDAMLEGDDAASSQPSDALERGMMMLDREGVDKAGDDDGGDDASFECIDAAHEAEGRWSGRGVCCCKDCAMAQLGDVDLRDE